ncbi:hypothetical protein NADFUDRAFT_52055 [Nadsonia fulvescens var. elongata DSM 6958]|uniref:Uncharacterized protein n=1 Tax=Nadsonia fulvescens var. elongata DSM 6958 TaxID=857566 RepID=A0A1E3PJT7_9ASCO|nr:hypothetical protein NADFUDRAFT_52055 [Nadsonia fulvescens var. elongata DSM 6958]
MTDFNQDSLFTTKLRSFLNQYEFREKQFKSVLKAKDLEIQVLLIERRQARQESSRTTTIYTELTKKISELIKEHGISYDATTVKPLKEEKPRTKLFDTYKTVFRNVNLKAKPKAVDEVALNTIQEESKLKPSFIVPPINILKTGVKSENNAPCSAVSSVLDSLQVFFNQIKADRDHWYNIANSRNSVSRLIVSRDMKSASSHIKIDTLMKEKAKIKSENGQQHCHISSFLELPLNSSQDTPIKCVEMINTAGTKGNTISTAIDFLEAEIKMLRIKHNEMSNKILEKKAENDEYKVILETMRTQKNQSIRKHEGLELKFSLLLKLFRHLQTERDHWFEVAAKGQKILPTDMEIITKNLQILKANNSKKDWDLLLNREIDSFNSQIEVLIKKKNAYYSLRSKFLKFDRFIHLCQNLENKRTHDLDDFKKCLDTEDTEEFLNKLLNFFQNILESN